MMFELSPFDRRNNNLFHYFDDLSRDLLRNDVESVSPCRTDIVDKGDYFELRADMPGFKKEEIHIDVDGDRLTISAQHKEETEEEKGRYVRRERRTGSLTRSFDISAVDASSISAGYANGVLELNLPKKAAKKPEAQRIEIK